MAPVLVWLYTRGARDRSRVGRQTLDPQISLDGLEPSLAAAGLFPVGQDAGAGAQPDFHTLLSQGGWFNRIVGAAVFELEEAPSLTAPWSPIRELIRRYWLATKFAEGRLVFLKVLAAARASTPHTILGRGPGHIPRSIFFQLTAAGASNLSEQVVAVDGRTISAHVEEWEGKLGRLRDTEGRFRTGAALPIGHAMLVATGVWAEWAVPVVQGRMLAGLGFHFAGRLFEDISLKRVSLDGMEERRALLETDNLCFGSAEQWDRLLTHLRELYQSHPSGELQQSVLWLVRRRDLAHKAAQQEHVHVFRFEQIISSLIMGGYLSSASNLRDALMSSINVLTDDPALRHSLVESLSRPRATLSRSTMYRHRMTVHMAFCIAEQQEVASTLQQSGVIRWATVDTSPQGGWDWIMSGARVMSHTDLVSSFRDSKRLCSGILCQDEACALFEDMSLALEIRQAAPAVVGSGRAGLTRKVRAVLHSLRLCSPSWQAAIRVLNSSFSWTGDLGTEAGFWQFRKHSRQIYGDWIVEDDLARGAPAPLQAAIAADEGCVAHGSFQIEPADVMVRSPVAMPALLAPPLRPPEASGQQAGAHADDIQGESAIVADGGICDSPGDEDVGNIAGGASADQDVAGCVDATTVTIEARQALLAAEAKPEGDDPYLVDLTSSLFVPGILHILSNAQQDLMKALESSSWFLSYLRHITRFLSRRWSRERFLETCCGAGALVALRPLFHKFHASVYEDRWGSIAHGVGELLRVGPAFRRAWNEDAYQRGAREAPQRHNEDEAKSVKIEIITAAVGDQRFWALLKIVDCVFEVMQVLQIWGESCPCHCPRLELHGPLRHQASGDNSRRERSARELEHIRCCPMRSLRAPGMATGEHSDMIKQLMHLVSGTLLLDEDVAGLPPQDKALILREFGRARQYLLYALHSKLSFWRYLPWALAGLAHEHEETAKHCAQRCLQMWEDQQSPPPSPPHPLAAQMLSPSSRSRAEMVEWSGGQRGLEEFPYLEALIARFRFIAVAERWVEAQHAITKKILARAPAAGVVGIAFAGAQRPLRQRLARDPRFLESLARSAELAQNPMRCLNAAGLSRHPSVQRLAEQVVSKRDLLRKHTPELTAILYHADPFSLYAPLPQEPEGTLSALQLIVPPSTQSNFRAEATCS